MVFDEIREPLAISQHVDATHPRLELNATMIDSLFSGARRLRKSRFGSSAIWATVGQITNRGPYILSAMLFSRALAIQDFAAYGYLYVSAIAISAVATLGVGVSVVRVFAEVNHSKCDSDGSAGTLLILGPAIGLLAGGITAAVPMSWVGAAFSHQQVFIAVLVFLTVAGVVPLNALIGFGLFKAGAIGSLAIAICYLAIAWRVQAYPTFEMAAFALLFSYAMQLVTNTLIVIFAAKRSRVRFSYPTVDGIKRVFQFGGPLVIVSLLSSVAPWLIGRSIASSDPAGYHFAHFSIGLQWFSLGMLIPSIVAKVTAPRLVELGGKGDTRRLVRRSLGVGIVTTSSMLALVALSSPTLQSLYGSNLNITFLFMISYMLPAVFASAGVILGNALVFSDNQVKWLQATSLWFLVVLAAIWALRNSPDRIGHVALLLSHSILAVVAFIQTRRLHLV